MKRLIICADGTWGTPETKYHNNVVRLTRAIASDGFSRGAYTVRSLAGLVRNAGILKSNKAERIPEAYAMYRCRGKAAAPSSLAAEDFRHRHCHADRTPLAFIGVWKTVGTLGIPSPIWGSLNKRSFLFHDTALSSSVKTAR